MRWFVFVKNNNNNKKLQTINNNRAFFVVCEVTNMSPINIFFITLLFEYFLMFIFFCIDRQKC